MVPRLIELVMMKSLNLASIVRHETSDLPERDRLALWRAQLSNVLIKVDATPDYALSRFDGEIVALPLDDLHLVKMTSTAVRIDRAAECEEGADRFLLLVNAEGAATVSSLERRLALGEGDAVLLDGAHPFTIHRQQGGSWFALRIPRGRVAQFVFLAETLVMRKLASAGGASHFLTASLDAVLLHAECASVAVRELAYRHITDLLSMLLAPDDSTAEACLPSDDNRGPSDVRLRIARAYIIEHAREPISVGHVADHLGITERHLQRLFEGGGITFTLFLNEVRLARAHAMLRDRHSDGLRIRSICFRTGFRDVSHFNRLFRARYGCTPAQVRKSRYGDAVSVADQMPSTP